MGHIFLSAATDKAITDETGTAAICTKIPGTFTSASGFQDPAPDGRFFKKIQIWTENGTSSDQLANLRLEDTDKILGPASAQFANYPVIQTLYDTDISGSASGGVGIPINTLIELSVIDPIDNRGFIFLPAEMSLCADFIAGDGASGRTVHVNYIWGKYSP